VRRLLTPRWIAGHLLALVAVVAFVNFGFWQLRRHDEKRDLRSAVEENLALPEVDLSAVEPEGALYRRVTAAGVFDRTSEALVLRSRNGVSGYHVLTPLVLEGGGGVLVDRGWVPPEVDDPQAAEAPAPTGRVIVGGVLWPSGTGEVPDTLPAVVKRIDSAAFDRATDYPIIGPYLVLGSQQPPPGDLPVPAGTPEISLGRHLGYAGQWFLFAVVVMVGYPILLRRTIAR
jgi:surfeit locus 1 family protein